MTATISPRCGPHRVERIFLEVLVPVVEVQPRDRDLGQAAVLDVETGCPVLVETPGLVLFGSLLCARVRAFDVDEDDYLVWGVDEFVARVRPVDGTPITIIY